MAIEQVDLPKLLSRNKGVKLAELEDTMEMLRKLSEDGLTVPTDYELTGPFNADKLTRLTRERKAVGAITSSR